MTRVHRASLPVRRAPRCHAPVANLRAVVAGVLSLFLAGLLPACTTVEKTPDFPDQRKVVVNTESPQTFAIQEPEPQNASDIPYEGRVLVDANGNLRKFYYLRQGRFEAIKDLITLMTGIPQEQIQSQPSWGEKSSQNGPGYELMLVTGTDDDFIKLDSFLDSLEAHTPMIEIEAQVVELLNNDDFQLGVQTFIKEMNRQGEGNDETLFDDISGVFDTDAFSQSEIVGGPFQGFLMNLGTMHSNLRWDILIEALAAKRLAKILSAPKITVLNGFTADITIGDKIPIQTFKSVAGTALIDVSFQDAAVKLSVTPNLVGKDTIQMVIKPEVSRVTGFTDPGPRGLANPIISTRNASTTVNIRNGYTYVIGGLIGNTEIKTERKTPILGDIPIVRYLFRSVSTTTTDTNLLFIIKPKIIYPDYYGEVSDRIFEPEVPPDDGQ